MSLLEQNNGTRFFIFLIENGVGQTSEKKSNTKKRIVFTKFSIKDVTNNAKAVLFINTMGVSLDEYNTAYSSNNDIIDLEAV